MIREKQLLHTEQIKSASKTRKVGTCGCQRYREAEELPVTRHLAKRNRLKKFPG